MTILIPAYQPDMHLSELIRTLQKESNFRIIIIDDGSTEASKIVFEALPANVIILHHKTNLGKGRALKTGMAYVKKQFPEETGIVFADADGQHEVRDILRICSEQIKHPDTLVLGARTFYGHIPWKSRAGNQITRGVFFLFSGKYLLDTQTGLRAFSTKLIPFLLSLEGNRYEYEMNMLLGCIEKGVALTEVPIRTIYEDKRNSTSHFRPIIDSARIYLSLLKFAGASFISFCIDYMCFMLIGVLIEIWFPGTVRYSVIISNILARCISAAVNYTLNKKFVYRSTDKIIASAPRYALLALGILVVNTALLQLLYGILKVPKAISKLLVELTLFVASILLQKIFVFKNSHIAASESMKK